MHKLLKLKRAYSAVNHHHASVGQEDDGGLAELWVQLKGGRPARTHGATARAPAVVAQHQADDGEHHQQGHQTLARSR